PVWKPLDDEVGHFDRLGPALLPRGKALHLDLAAGFLEVLLEEVLLLFHFDSAADARTDGTDRFEVFQGTAGIEAFVALGRELVAWPGVVLLFSGSWRRWGGSASGPGLGHQCRCPYGSHDKHQAAGPAYHDNGPRSKQESLLPRLYRQKWTGARWVSRESGEPSQASRAP